MRKLLLVLILAAPVPLLAQIFNLETNRQPVASLDGLWHFHPGDNPAWASSGFDDSQWPLLRSGESWTKQGYPGISRYAWYRFQLQVPDGSKPLSLLLTDIFTSYRVYADGRLIGGFGYLPPHALTLDPQPRAYDLPRSDRRGPRAIQIAIRVWQAPVWAYYVPGGSVSPGNIAGNSALIHQQLSLIDLLEPHRYANLYTYSILATLFGLLALGLFLLNRADREYLWFAMVLLASAADAAAQIARPSLIPVQIFDLSDGFLTGLFSVAAMLFFSRVLRARRTFWWWFAVCAASLDAITVFAYWSGLTSVPVSGMLAILCILPSQLWILIVLVRSAVRKGADARLLLFPALLMFGYSVASSLALVTYQWGWQRITIYLDPLLLRHPFPLYFQDVVNTVFAFFMMAFLIRRFSLARREEERLSREFEAARTIQALLIPPHPPATPGFSVETVYLPAAEVGGDFFHIQPAGDGSLLIISGDVSGKGLNAAMTVSIIIGALRNDPGRAPAQILRNLNRILHGNIAGFATCSAALIGQDGGMTIANAGHLPPYRNGSETEFDSGLPLGVDPAAEYSESSIQLAPGDTLTFLSDGVVEARNATGELFGFDRTRDISNQAAEHIAQAAQAFGQEDDITVLTLTFAPAEVLHA
ncbi:MAG: PP2C family protein-serine/threonine phosphatase [Acidobacteriaceae bacterium]